MKVEKYQSQPYTIILMSLSQWSIYIVSAYWPDNVMSLFLWLHDELIIIPSKPHSDLQLTQLSI